MMKRAAVLVVSLALLVPWLQREVARGTFDVIERHFVAWLAANADAPARIPPLTLVLYDEEASELSGKPRMSMLDAALFTRAASRLGAAAAGVEGLQGNPARMAEAAGAMPVFGGYSPDRPPSAGWTPLPGRVIARWPEMPGLIGAPGVFPRGFIITPPDNAGPRELQMVARNAGRPVPSFLALAWAAAQGWQAGDLAAADGGVFGPQGGLPAGSDGKAWFFFAGPIAKMTMNELLVISEEYERTGGDSPLRGRVLVLSPATADVLRLSREGGAPAIPPELWAQAWEPLRRGRLFVAAGWWFAPALWLASCALGLGVAQASRRTALLAWMITVMVCLLAALGAYAGSRLFLPLAPMVIALSAAAVLGRIVR